MATIEIQFDVNALYCPANNAAALRLLQGSDVQTFVRTFDDSTEEFVHGKFRLPDELDASGTVTFCVAVTADTATASKNVQHRFAHVALQDGEDFDVAFTDKDSGDKAIESTQDNVSLHTWSETVASLDWTGGDIVLFRYSRIAPSADNLVGDMYLLHLTIKIPVN